MLTECFPDTVSDLAKQREVLLNMHKYRAALPVFQGQVSMQMNEGHFGNQIKDTLSMCDTITVQMDEGGETISEKGQIMEVYEHLLHAITDVGFALTWKEMWGLNRNSDLWNAMQEAITAKVYDVSSFKNIPNTGDDVGVRDRIELQEFAYWGISTIQGVYKSYHGDAAPEWTLLTKEEVQNKLPLFWSLYSKTAGTVLGVPSETTFTQVGKLATKDAASTAPWPLTPRSNESGGTPTPVPIENNTTTSTTTTTTEQPFNIPSTTKTPFTSNPSSPSSPPTTKNPPPSNSSPSLEPHVACTDDAYCNNRGVAVTLGDTRNACECKCVGGWIGRRCDEFHHNVNTASAQTISFQMALFCVALTQLHLYK
eukprot:g6188.t1